MSENEQLKKEVGALREALSLNSQRLSRLAYANGNKTFNGKRDLYEVLGYNHSPKFADYMAKYTRQDISQRIINAYPDAIWTKRPTVQEDEDKQNQTEFERKFDELAERLKIFHYLNRLDKLAGIGSYAVLLIGAAGGTDLKSELNKSTDIMYLMPFSEDNAKIVEYEEDVTNYRYGQPKVYKLMTGGYSSGGSAGMSGTAIEVNYTRVMHISEGLLENDTFGTPRLEPIYNRLDDLEKVVGGSAEIFWVNGRGGLNLNVDKDLQLKDADKLQEHAEDYIHQLSRILQTKGMDVKTLELAVNSPEKHVSVILDLISGATGIPKRILVGSERGELASSQDENNWWARVEERRDNYCEPLVLRPFIGRMMELGVLPTVEDYEVIWPDLTSSSDLEKADISSKVSTSIANYVNSNGGDLVIPPQQFVEEVLGMEYREEDIKEQLESEARQMEEDQKEFERQESEKEKEKTKGVKE